MRNMHIKGCRNFVYPTEKGVEWHRKSEQAFREINKPKADVSVFSTHRRGPTIDEIHAERIKRRMAVAS